MREFTAAKKNETTMSQMTSLENAVKAWEKVSVFVKIETVTARNAHAPVGRGSNTRPVMADTCNCKFQQHGLGTRRNRCCTTKCHQSKAQDGCMQSQIKRCCGPAMVETKMDSKVHPCVVSPLGMGTKKRSANPRPMLRSSGSGLTPGHVFAGACSDEAPAHTTADAVTWAQPPDHVVFNMQLVGMHRCAF